MNIEQIKAMSDEELNIEIAELTGWVYLYTDENGKKWWRTPLDGYTPDQPPNYVKDLNAMYEVENILLTCGRLYKEDKVRGRTDWYNNDLSIVMGKDLKNNFSLIHATARQRAEAFVLTIGGWG